MPIYVLDTNVIIAHIADSLKADRALSEYSEQDALKWAQTLIKVRRSNAIVRPVSIELLAGARSAHELKLFRAFLTQFRFVDDGRLILEDWEEVARLAAWVPRDGKRRQLVDCLIRALAKRLNFEVITQDKRFFH